MTKEHVNIDKEVVNSCKECFDKLVEHVQHTFLENVSKLSTVYANLREAEGNINVEEVFQKDVKRRLKREYGDSLMFYHKDRRENEFIFHKSIPVEDDIRSWLFFSGWNKRCLN